MSNEENTPDKFKPDYKQLGYTLRILQRAAIEIAHNNKDESAYRAAICMRQIADHAGDVARADRMERLDKDKEAAAAAARQAGKTESMTAGVQAAADKPVCIFPPEKNGKKLVGITVNFTKLHDPDTVSLPATVYLPNTGSMHVITGRKDLSGGYPCSDACFEHGVGLVRRCEGSTLYPAGFVHLVHPVYVEVSAPVLPAGSVVEKSTLKRFTPYKERLSCGDVYITGPEQTLHTCVSEYCVLDGKLYQIDRTIGSMSVRYRISRMVSLSPLAVSTYESVSGLTLVRPAEPA